MERGGVTPGHSGGGFCRGVSLMSYPWRYGARPFAPTLDGTRAAWQFLAIGACVEGRPLPERQLIIGCYTGRIRIRQWGIQRN